MNTSALSPTKPVASAYTPPMTIQYTAHIDPVYAVPIHATPIDMSTIVRVDAWEAGLCGCFSACVNCCMVAWLPCVSLAQISQRIGWAKYWHVLLALLGLYLLELVMSHSVLASSYHRYWFDYRDLGHEDYRSTSTSVSSWTTSYYYTDSSDDSSDEPYVSLAISATVGTIVSFCTFLGSFAGFAMVFITWALRSRIRTLYNLPGSCCEDCFVSFCCSCCAVAQMATHVKTYKKGSCDFGPVDTLPAFLPQ